MFLVGIEPGQIAVGLAVNHQIGILRRIVNRLSDSSHARLIGHDSFTADLAGNIDDTRGVSIRVIDGVITGQKPRPRTVRMLGASRALVERWIFIIADLQLAIFLRVETGPIDWINGAPCSDRRRSTAVDPRVIIRNLVDDITRAEARLIPSGLAATRDARRHGGTGAGLILAARQRSVNGVRHDHPHDDRFLGEVPSGNGAGLRAE